MVKSEVILLCDLLEHKKNKLRIFFLNHYQLLSSKPESKSDTIHCSFVLPIFVEKFQCVKGEKISFNYFD